MNRVGQAQMLLVGRTLLSLLFLVSGIRGAVLYPTTVAYFTYLGFPAPYAMVALALAIEVAGAVCLMIGWQTRRVAWLMIVFVAIATAMAHRFWEFDAAQYANQVSHFLKNVAIIGGMLYIVAFGPGALSLDGRRS